MRHQGNQHTLGGAFANVLANVIGNDGSFQP
jgi:hypothetical protein